ncbi:hypothetical protein [Coleofasciculus sp. FACHB-SPT9]|uniref:nSTAND1 domain-containing NTPase n=1 Tax=Cyanophyceae TaxID=3028117 RepID=UPI001682381A|nr:hypothetical protein [Coleofasciculus sp. FACHB-SPT9]MBD1890514.1 hypothetical protein [Coleofasciculus sp. FACHB-SPT9]
MSESHRAEDVAVHNERSLKKLAWAIEASVGQFKLFLARCNYTSLRSQLVEQLRELMSVEIRILELNESEKTLYARIHAELDSQQPDALMVFGLELVGDLDELLSTTNQVREEFRKNFPFPLVLWVSDEVLKKLLQLAPDFESWATTTDFTLTTHELVDFLKETAERFFERNLTVTLSACREIKLACQDLQSRKQVLDLELRANIESLLGLAEYVDYANRNLDIALEHYQKGLELWQQSNNLERQGQILSDIAFCYYLKAFRRREIAHPDWQATRHYLRQSLEVFEQAQRPDLVANSILGFGRILRRLQDWEQLQTLAQKALQQHQTENRPIELAQDYGFLAEVALEKEDWAEAKEFAQKALDVLSDVPSFQSANRSGAVYKLPDKRLISSDLSRYWFILGQAQQHLDQPQEAIRNLETAKRVGSPEHDTQLYLDILCYLQKLYFEQKEYLKAFEIKLEQQSIEQQYGFRAFVGAGRIQPRRQAKLALTQVESQETIAPEITASGRQFDVERLVQRIGEPSYKLIVIHGQSGVGKSSLVNGGLVPALKQKAIGTSDVLPVPMRVYTRWVGELGKLLAEALLEKGIDLPTPLDSQAAILEQLQQSESLNLRTVLIFDQFEEFFFVYPTPGERRQFFEFVGACLNILPVKVILSLREDYLHYLLECDRLPSMKTIGNDILTRNVRYQLGNFSPADAKAIVQRLTERSSFHLEPALIEELVQELAGNLEEVRPIELQIVGAQLQTENVTTLAEYRERGQKEELVKRYLAEVVKDCGAENKQVAELILYLLTDEKGTRPVKTRAEVEKDLQVLAADLSVEASRLDLVLKIFVDSGLVILLPELPTDRYQLVHDYLAAFIRQQQEPKLNELIAELEQERKQRQKAEVKRQITEQELGRAEQAKQILENANQKAKQRVRIGSAVLVVSLAIAAVAGGLASKAAQALKEAQEITRLEQAGVNSLREFQSGKEIEALLLAVQNGQLLKSMVKDGRSLQEYPTVTPLFTLQTIVDNIREKNQLGEHSGTFISADLNPHQKQIVTAERDGTVRLWNFSGKQLAEFNVSQGVLHSVNFVRGGKQIVTIGGRTVNLWDLSGKKLAEFKAPQDASDEWSFISSFNSDNKQIVITGENGFIRLWNLSGQKLVAFKVPQDASGEVSLSPDSKQIATAGQDGLIRLWNLSGQKLAEFKGHDDIIFDISFSPDGKQIATASADNTARLWNLSGERLAELKGHQAWVRKVAFSPDGKRIASGGDDGTARLWDLSGQQLAEFGGHEGTVWNVSFHSDGQQLVTLSETMRLWNLSGEHLSEFKAHQDNINEVSFSPDGKKIATAGDDGVARLWSLSGRKLAELKGRGLGVILSISFSSDSKKIATGETFIAESINDQLAHTPKGNVRLWDVSGRLLNEFKAHQNLIHSISFSPDGKQIATAGGDGIVRLWDLSGQQLKEFGGNKDSNSSVSFSPDGKQIAAAGRNGIVRIWNLDGKQLVKFKVDKNLIFSVSFSPDNQRIATAGEDGFVQLWKTNGQLLKKFKAHQSFASSISFSPDSQRIATAGGDGIVRLWNLAGQQLAEFKGTQDRFGHVNFSPNNKQIVIAGENGTVQLWRVDDLNGLLVRGCDWLHDYLKTSSKVNESDRHLCDDITIRK